MLFVKMPTRCAVRGCSNKRNIQKGIALHTIQFYGDDRPEAKKQRTTEKAMVRFREGETCEVRVR